MAQHLILRLEAPLLAFGGTMIDAIGPTLEFPMVSLVTGLIANALGWRRADREKHQRLQERIVMGVRIDRLGTELREYQTALLFEDEKGWTTRGVPETREKSPSYKRGRSGRREITHQRYRYYRADALVTVALRLAPQAETPTLDEVAAALDRPCRPLFIGRKSCLPSGPVLAGPPVEAGDVLAALRTWPLQSRPPSRRNVGGTAPDDRVKIVMPAGEGETAEPFRVTRVTDHRDWISGVHTGESALHIFTLPRTDFPPAEGAQL